MYGEGLWEFFLKDSSAFERADDPTMKTTLLKWFHVFHGVEVVAICTLEMNWRSDGGEDDDDDDDDDDDGDDDICAGVLWV